MEVSIPFYLGNRIIWLTDTFQLIKDSYGNAPYTSCEIYELFERLDNLKRFGGHAREWSVLDHSMVGELVHPQPNQFLVHDLHEAFTGDVSSPLKKYGTSPQWKDIENRLDHYLFTVLAPYYPKVSQYAQTDEAMAVVEAKYFLKPHQSEIVVSRAKPVDPELEIEIRGKIESHIIRYNRDTSPRRKIEDAVAMLKETKPNE